MGLLTIFKHRANIRRLLAGTEPKITGKKKQVFPQCGKLFTSRFE